MIILELLARFTDPVPHYCFIIHIEFRRNMVNEGLSAVDPILRSLMSCRIEISKLFFALSPPVAVRATTGVYLKVFG